MRKQKQKDLKCKDKNVQTNVKDKRQKRQNWKFYFNIIFNENQYMVNFVSIKRYMGCKV